MLADARQDPANPGGPDREYGKCGTEFWTVGSIADGTQ